MELIYKIFSFYSDSYENIFTGKSTIAALIERLYDIDNGTIEIDGVDIKDLDPSWLRGELIGYINQVKNPISLLHGNDQF